jgi:hypothetical protein
MTVRPLQSGVDHLRKMLSLGAPGMTPLAVKIGAEEPAEQLLKRMLVGNRHSVWRHGTPACGGWEN